MEFRILGPVEVWSQGHRIEINALQRRTVLALLLLDVNRVVSVDRIAEALWLDDPPPRARNSIQGHVSALRRLLTREGAEQHGIALRTRQPGYLLEADPDRVDAHRFRQLCDDARGADDQRACELYAEAMRLWRGEPLTDVSLAPERGTAFEDLRFTAAEEYAAARLRRGGHHAVAADLPPLIAEQPLRERLVSHLMVALVRAGRQGEAIDLYHRTRTQLVDQLGVDPGSDLTEAYRLVLAGDTPAKPAGSPTALSPAAVETAAPVPAQLPTDVRHFTARDEELATLRALATGQGAGRCSSAVVSAVGGAAGVGKSALAIRTAHTLVDQFPDGQLFVDLRGFAAAPPLAPGEVLGWFLTALGTSPSRIPSELAERAALYRTLLANRRVLVVLDNARSSEQVRPLLPGSPTCFVLVTSRNRLDGLVAQQGAAPLPLNVLSHDDAVALLARILGPARLADRAAVRRLVECCDRLPLALRLAAARLAALPTASVAEFARELEDEQRRLDSLAVEDGDTAIRGALELSYRALPTSAARLFRLLGAHPGPDFTVPLVAALAGVERAAAQHLMATLVAASLVQVGTPERYVLHDLVRLYARQCFDADEPLAARQLAVHRLVDYYLHEAYVCHGVVRPNVSHATHRIDHVPPVPFQPAAAGEALAWLDTERANLRMVTSLALRAGMPELAWQLAEAQWSVFELRCRYDDGIAVYTVGLDAARACRDRDAECRLLRALASVYRAMGNHADALSLSQEAVVAATSLNDHDLRCATLGTLGLIHGATARHDEAVRCFQQALSIARQHRLPFREVGALGHLGYLAVIRLRFRDAVEHLGQALTVSRRHGVTAGASTLLNNYGEACRGLERYDEALTRYREALAIAQRDGWRRSEAEALYGIGLTLQATAGTAAARRYWEAAHAIYVDMDPERAAAVAALLAAPEKRSNRALMPAATVPAGAARND